MTINEMWLATKYTKKVFAELLGVPYQTMVCWIRRDGACPPYTNELIEYYLEKEGYLRR